MAPISGLILQEIIDHEARPELQVARICFDILGKIPIAEFEIAVRTVRSGKTIELVQAEAVQARRPFLRATVWRILRTDTAAVAGGGPAPLPDPDSLPASVLATRWQGGYITSLEVRPVRTSSEGRGTAWLRTDVALRDRGAVSDLARLTGLVDTANGVAPRHPPNEWVYPNVDLTMHLHRQPVGTWVGLATEAVWGPTGLGVTSTTIHDELGPWGRAEQILTVRPR